MQPFQIGGRVRVFHREVRNQHLCVGQVHARRQSFGTRRQVDRRDDPAPSVVMGCRERRAFFSRSVGQAGSQTETTLRIASLHLKRPWIGAPTSEQFKLPS